jgi:hypothetical protein
MVREPLVTISPLAVPSTWISPRLVIFPSHTASSLMTLSDTGDALGDERFAPFIMVSVLPVLPRHGV